MFFSEDLLTRKKGTFGIIWLAATLGPRNKRITRRDLSNVDLSRTCELIAEPPEPMALRLSGCLLVGVARVYNQNYEIFYADVNQFHTALRRSIATDFTSASGVTSSAGVSVDMVGDGKSRFDQITFTGFDPSRQTGLDLELDFVDWRDPVGKRRRPRRSSTKLDSLPSQQDNDRSESEDTDSEEDDLASELGNAREKRHRISSSPMIGSLKDTTRKPRSIYHRVDSIRDLDRDLAFRADQTIDLNLFGEAGDISISAPSGRGFELPNDCGIEIDEVFGFPDGQDYAFDDHDRSQGYPNDMLPDARGPSGLKSAMKKGKDGRRSDGSLSEIEEELEERVAKKPRIRKTKKVTFDHTLELNEDIESSQAHRNLVTEQLRAHNEKAQAKSMANRAIDLVDGAGEWLEFFDHDLQIFFATLTKAPQFKWELDVAAHRAGLEWVDPETEQMRLSPQQALVHPQDIFAAGQMDINVYDYNNLLDHGAPAQERPTRQGSEVSEMEILRRGSQLSGLPWQDTAFGPRDSDTGYDAAGLPDSSFTPGSLRLSVMTPQELRLRLNSRHGSSSGPLNSLGVRHQKARSRSGSILGRTEGEPKMLFGDNDLELPTDDYALDITASQAEKRADLPAAFGPESLAILETQCRDFLSYIEQTVNEKGRENLAFEDLVSRTALKKVAATAFYNCLTLATKHLVDLAQPDHWGPIGIRLSV